MPRSPEKYIQQMPDLSQAFVIYYCSIDYSTTSVSSFSTGGFNISTASV